MCTNIYPFYIYIPSALCQLPSSFNRLCMRPLNSSTVSHWFFYECLPFHFLFPLLQCLSFQESFSDCHPSLTFFIFQAPALSCICFLQCWSMHIFLTPSLGFFSENDYSLFSLDVPILVPVPSPSFSVLAIPDISASWFRL